MVYLILKYVHTVAATVTIAGFVLRGYWMLTESALLQHRVTRVAPHIVDAVFFLAGVGMLWMLHLNPFAQTWLIAKFAGLAAYIVLGSIAIRRGATKQARAIAFVAAVSAFAYVAGVALARSPLSWISLGAQGQLN